MTIETIIPYILAIIVILIIIALIYFKKITLDNIYIWAKQLILLAEDYLDDASGQAKLAYVADKIYSFIPRLLRFLVTKERIIVIINIVFDSLAEQIEDEHGVVHTVPKTDKL